MNPLTFAAEAGSISRARTTAPLVVGSGRSVTARRVSAPASPDNLRWFLPTTSLSSFLRSLRHKSS